MTRCSVGIFVLYLLSLFFCIQADAQISDNPASRDVRNLPFTLTWIRGTCSNCRTARNFSDVQFVSQNEAWAIGFMPPGETGAGDYSVLHTVDGGKTWTEIPEPWQHNAAPTISFAGQHVGWLRDVDLDSAEDRLLLTRDSGVHWQRLPMRDLFVDDVQLLGNGIGFGDGFDIYEKQGYLIISKDNGWHWSKALLPKGFSGERMDFVDARDGYVAGCLGRQVTVIRTADGGSHWKTSAIDLPLLDAKRFENCVFEPDGLEFMDAQHGWLLTSRHTFGPNENESLTVAWSTTDGGKNWKPIYREALTEGPDGLHFVDGSLGYMWKYQSDGDQGKGILLYTINGGSSWSQFSLPRAISGCRQYEAQLDCAAGGYWVLRIGRHVGSR